MPTKEPMHKVWVRRPGSSATLVHFNEKDVVDDIRGALLQKYGNTLGRLYDAPDVGLRLIARDDTSGGRFLCSDEVVLDVLQKSFPGGQTMEEALTIDVPARRSPSASSLGGGSGTLVYGPSYPRPMSANPMLRGALGHSAYSYDARTDYFGAEAVPGNSSAHISNYLESQRSQARAPNHLPPGQAPEAPSLGGTRRPHKERPKVSRHRSGSAGGADTEKPHEFGEYAEYPGSIPKKSSSKATQGHLSNNRTASMGFEVGPKVFDKMRGMGMTVGIRADGTVVGPGLSGAITSPPSRYGSSGRPGSPLRSKRSKKLNRMLEEELTRELRTVPLTVPPINVLIVEDNIINLKLLEAFVKRLKVRWQTAMNGREAVAKWRQGGFHLVLMDIQLPIVSGLEATREIRRLERANSIGAFVSTLDEAFVPSSDPGLDKLENLSLFKSPVIIVALTASSLNSDRNEALEAGCNDFLTKPVNFIWLEKKIMEWGCMQALIDYEGWREWKAMKVPAVQEEEDAKKAAMEIAARKAKKQERLEEVERLERLEQLEALEAQKNRAAAMPSRRRRGGGPGTDRITVLSPTNAYAPHPYSPTNYAPYAFPRAPYSPFDYSSDPYISDPYPPEPDPPSTYPSSSATRKPSEPADSSSAPT